MTKSMKKTATMFAAVLMFQGISFGAPERATDSPAADRPAADRPAADRPAAGEAREAAEPAARREAGGRDAANANFDQKFVEFAANNNLYEIALGNVVQERAQSDEIKQFAKMMVDDHTQANQQLQQAAQKAGVQVPSQMDEVHRLKLTKMQEKRGQMLERGYAIDQTAGHVKAILKFRDATQMAQNQDLKTFATAALPKLQKHFQHASKLSGWQQISGEAQPAGATERGTGTGTGTGAGASGTDRGQTSGSTSGGQGPTGPGGAGDTGSTPRNQ